MYAQTTELGTVSGIFDTIKSVFSTVSKAVKVVENGVQVVVHPPGVPPVILNATDPDVLKKAVGIAKAIASSISIQTGKAPTAAEQIESAAAGAVRSPVGIALMVGAGLLVFSMLGRRSRRRA